MRGEQSSEENDDYEDDYYDYEHNSDDDSLEDSNIPPDMNDMFEPLYPGAKITIAGAYCAIMHFKSTFRCPFTVIAQLLQLLQLLCPSENRLPKSVYSLRKFFQTFKAQQTRKQYCSSCHERVEGGCSRQGCVKGEPDCFIYMDTTKQFRTILSRKFVT